MLNRRPKLHSIGGGWLVVAALAAPGGAEGAEPTPADRGREALLGRAFLGPAWGLGAYEGAGKTWGGSDPDPTTDRPSYDRAFRERYGLHPAPFPNDGLPMGIRRAVDPKDGRVGLQVDCLQCHGGSIGGRSYVGLGNSQLDAIGLFEDLSAADGKPMKFLAFTVNTSRGTVNAGQMAAFLLSLRNRDLSRRLFPLPLGGRFAELDTPAWWNLKHKDTLYYDGRTDGRSSRSLMQFLLGEATADRFRELEPVFQDIHAYLRTLEAPEYPFPVDTALADLGRGVFDRTCARCHGTYGDRLDYPNKIVPLDVVGTDPIRAEAGSDALVAHYNASWFGELHQVETEMVGYVAPPLEGIWATAPYLHNGSVPTLHHLLDSADRPDRYRRPPSTDFEHYDPDRVGWKFEVVPPGPDPDPGLTPYEARKIFDSSRFGLSNRGHEFGDALSPDERRALIEYLKTL